MRVCIVNEFFYPDSTGGTGTVLSDLVRSLRHLYADVEIEVVTSSNLYRKSDTRLPAYENWNGVNIHRLATPRPNSLPTPLRLVANLLFSLGALAKLVQLGRFDALLVGTAPPMVALCGHVLNQLNGTPFVYIVYDLEPDRSVTMKVVPKSHPVAFLFRQSQKRWLHSAAKVVVLGRCMREHLRQAYSLPPQQVEVIPIGSAADEIVPAAKTTRFRAEHGLNGFVVLYSGNFGRYHNFDTILNAARQLQTKRPEICFVLVGGGAQKEHIARRVADEQIANVRLLDFVAKEAYNDLLASADVSLVTLEPGMEGLCVPSKFYSILASGRPTIAAVSPKSEVALVIDEEQCGLHLDQGETEPLVNALIALAENPAEAERMGVNARQALEAKYSTEHLARQYYATLQEAAASRAPRKNFSAFAGRKRRINVAHSPELESSAD